MQLVVGDHMQMLNQSKRFANVLVVTLRSALMQQKCFWRNTGQTEGTRYSMSSGVSPISNRQCVPANTHWQPCCQTSPFKIRQRPVFHQENEHKRLLKHREERMITSPALPAHSNTWLYALHSLCSDPAPVWEFRLVPLVSKLTCGFPRHCLNNRRMIQNQCGPSLKISVEYIVDFFPLVSFVLPENLHETPAHNQWGNTICFRKLAWISVMFLLAYVWHDKKYIKPQDFLWLEADTMTHFLSESIRITAVACPCLQACTNMTSFSNLASFSKPAFTESVRINLHTYWLILDILRLMPRSVYMISAQK